MQKSVKCNKLRERILLLTNPLHAMTKVSSQMSFSAHYVEKRRSKRLFLQQIETALNWEPIQKILQKHYPKGKAHVGRRAYSPLVLFKMTLLQTWYNLSDYQVEEQVSDMLSFNHFCGLLLEDEVPDHSVICRFRKALNATGCWDTLLAQINDQFSQQGLLVQQGGIIDASLTPTLRKPKGKATYILEEHASNPLKKEYKPGVDQQAKWIKKAGKLQYGYKRHYCAESTHGLVLAVHTTAANVHDGQCLAQCIDQVSLPPGSRILADKGYASAKNEALLRTRGLRSGIQRKASRGRPLSTWEKRYNQLIGRSRYKIERVFGSIKRWFGRLEARYVGLVKTHGQHVLEAIAYNLYRLPGIIVSRA